MKNFILLFVLLFLSLNMNAADRSVFGEIFSSQKANQDVVVDAPGTGDLLLKTNSSTIMQLESTQATVNVNTIINATGSITVPTGTTAQQPATGSAGMFRHNSDTKSFEGYTNGAWGSIGGGGGGLDVFHSDDYEVTATGDWSTGNNATILGGGTLVGALATTQDVIRDTSFEYTHHASSATVNDYFCSAAITLDPKNKSNDNGYVFYYTYDGDDDDIQVFIWDVTNSANIAAAKGLELIKARGDPTRYSTSFYPPSTATDVRYCFQVLVTNANKVLTWDDTFLSTNPFVDAELTEITEWTSFTPIATGFGTITAASGRWRRVGDSMQVEGQWITGTSTAVDGQIDIPGGYSYDSAKISGSGTQNRLGVIEKLNATNVYDGSSGLLFADFSDLTSLYTSLASSSSANMAKTDGNATSSSGLGLLFKFTVPISGWEATSKNIVTPVKAGTEYYQADTSTAHGSTNTVIPVFDNERKNTISKTGTIANTAADGFSFTALKRTRMSVSGTADATGSEAGWSIDSSQLTTAISSITITDRVALGAVGTTANESLQSTWNGILEVGEVLRFHSAGAVSNSAGYHISIIASPAEAIVLGALPIPKVAYLKDVKSSGTNGGGSTANTVHTRTLNTVSGPNPEIVSLSANQFTLAPGMYTIEAEAPGAAVDRHQVFLHDGTSYIQDGSSEYADTTIAATTTSNLRITVVITSATTYEIRHWTEAAFASQGLGISANGTSNPQSNEIYTQVTITKYYTGN